MTLQPRDFDTIRLLGGASVVFALGGAMIGATHDLAISGFLGCGGVSVCMSVIVFLITYGLRRLDL
jgi:hypothetical protein